jgi:CheY-like chemotaxis protein
MKITTNMKPIIIADDEEKVREMYASTIRRFTKAEIDEVGNGIELVEKVRQKDYSLIIVDNKMPKMDGLEAIVEIRKFNNSVPICMISFGEDDTESKAIESGATDYIQKPVFTPQLKALIEKYS